MSKRLFIALVGAAAFAARAADAPTTGDPEAGAAKSATCVACHGMDGNSPAPEWPKLAGQHTDYIVRQTLLVRDGGRENLTMLPFVQGLSNQDIADIAAYYATQKILPGVADDSPIEGGKDTYAGLGRKLYHGGKLSAGVPACQACHGPSGRGIEGAGFPALAGQHATYTAARLRFFHEGSQYGTTEDDRSLIMKTIAQRLNETEIDALATYIEGLHRNDPGAPAVAAAPAIETAPAPAVPAAPEATPTNPAPVDETAAPAGETTPDAGT
jgi:cytochrome c553